MASSLSLSLPHLVQKGWRIAVVAEHAVAPEAEIIVETSGVWRNFLLRRFGLQREVNRLRQRWPAAVVVGLPGFPLRADLTAFHFSQSLWLQKQLSFGITDPRALLRLILHGWLWCWESLHLALNGRRTLLPVSDSMAAHVKARVSHAEVEVLPNCYDPHRFNIENRHRYAQPQRAAFGFSDRDFVFTFVSQGHYERKGFWLVVSALERLRSKLNKTPFIPRLLVIGGKPSTLQRLRRRLDRQFSDWPAYVTFTGSLTEPEQAMSAADALLFPSYFEAFCLAEIESAALGLPLFLTPHGGTEMILSDGTNGLLLSSDPQAIADRLESLLEGNSTLGKIDQQTRRPVHFTPSVGRALNPQTYADRLDVLLEKTRSKGRTPR